MKVYSVILLLTGMLALCLSASAEETLVQQGKAVYQSWCSPCHAGGPNHPGTAALETKYEGKIPAVLEERTGLTPEFVRFYVRNGISIMPFFRKVEISDADLDAIGAYLSRP